MFNRFLSIRTALMPLLAVALLAVSSIRATAVSDRMRLGADVLAHSRGGNPNAVKISPSCNVLNQNGACMRAGNACATCTILLYNDTAPMGPGNVMKMGNGDCDDNVLGTCGANLTCNQNVPPVFLGLCQTPPAVVNQ